MPLDDIKEYIGVDKDRIWYAGCDRMSDVDCGRAVRNECRCRFRRAGWQMLASKRSNAGAGELPAAAHPTPAQRTFESGSSTLPGLRSRTPKALGTLPLNLKHHPGIKEEKSTEQTTRI